MKLYHCSPKHGIQTLLPNTARYFDKPRQVCLTSLYAMALMYAVKNFEYTYGYSKSGNIYYMEHFPHALAALYAGKSASLYVCEHKKWFETTPIPNEYTSQDPVDVAEEILIPDAYSALLEQERNGTLRILRYEELSEAQLEWIGRVEKEVILEKGLLETPDSAFARYLREHYPKSWESAEKQQR